MIQSIRNLVERIGSLIGERPFSCGFLAGLAAAFAVLILLFLLCLIFRSRKLRFIEVPSEGGTLRIDAKAVRGAVQAIAANFPVFEVRKVALYGKQSAVRLDVAADFVGDDESVAESAARFRAAVARMMTETLGMEKPARIELEILRSGAEIAAKEETGAPSSAPEDIPSASSESETSC